MKTKYRFKDVVLPKGGFLRGPFGGDLKKEIFVEKNSNNFKVYEQGVVLNSDKTIGRYYISENDYKAKLHKFSVQDKDFLVSCSGVNMGAIYQLKSPFEQGIINQALLRIRLNNEIIDDNFFLYFFKELISRKIITGSGDSTIPNFPGLEVIKNLEFDLPEKDIQIKVGHILSLLDSKIEFNNRINAELEAMAKTIYDYWFVQFEFPISKEQALAMGKPKLEGKPYKSSGGKMVWNAELKREVPDIERWRVDSLSNAVNVYDSKRIPLSNMEREKKKGKYPYYGATCIMDYVDDYIFDGEYILLAEDGSVMDEKGYPIVQFIWGKTWVNNHAHVLQAKIQSNNEYLFYLLKSISVVQIMTGSIQKKINQENLMNVKVIYPDEETLYRFSKLATPIRKQIINIYEENQKLSELRDWLLPMLMNGQVKVK